MRCSLCDAEVEFTYLVEADFAGLSADHLVEVRHEPEDARPLCLACLLAHLKHKVQAAETADVADE
jgi:hypothetical protein